MKSFDISKLANDPGYLGFVKKLKFRGPNQVGGLRRRAIIGMLYRGWQESGLPSITGVEVGVKHGSLSGQLLNSLPCLSKLVMVDPWREYPQYHADREKYGYAGRDQSSWDMMYRLVVRNIAKYGKRSEIRRTTSLEEAAACVARGERHFFVYIDADHTHDAVVADCEAWLPVVMAGGLLCGDDYVPPDHDRRPSCIPVSTAVERFAERHGFQITALHRNWFIQPR